MSISPPRTVRNAKAAGARRLRHELTTVLNEPGADGAPPLRRIVEALVKDASEGNLASMKEVFDRLAGKPYVGADELPRALLVSWKQHTPDLPAPVPADGEE